MSNTLKFGDGKWAVKEGSTLAYNDENGNFKPLPFTFDRSTSATRVNKEGLIEVVSNNEPRIDFLNDSKGALLLEPSRSNIMPYSEDFSEWGNTSGITKTSSQYNELTGNNDAYKIETDGSSGFLNIVEVTNTTSGVNTFSLFAKKGTNNEISFRTLGTVDARLAFNLDTGEQISSLNAVSTNFKDYGNGWYRISLTFDGSNNTFIVYPNIQGVANSGNVYVYGAQLEQGSYATSYIPTQGSSVTRVIDICSVNNLDDNVASQNAWTAAGEFIKGQDKDNALYILFAYYLETTNLFRIRDFFNSVRFYLFEPTEQSYGIPFNLGQSVKWSIRAKSDGTYTLYVNGNLIVERSGTFRKLDAYRLFGNAKVSLNNLKIYNEALTDQELINLTKI